MSISLSSTASDEISTWTTPGACQPIIFRVELFGGRIHENDPHDAMASYADASNQAHFVLGVFVLGMVAVWSAFVLEQMKLRNAYYCSAFIQMAMGTYLMSWVFILMHPSDLAGLYAYSTHDLLQLQHMSIAALLIAAGWMELLHGAMQLLKANEWHLAWSMNAAMTGMVFIAHPQHAFHATVKHMLLGIALVLASILFARAKQSNFTNAHAAHDVDWAMVCAGLLYSMAAIILVIFRETPRPVHMGTSTVCQGSWYLTCTGYVIASLTVFISIIAVFCNWYGQIQEMRKLGYDHSYEMTRMMNTDMNRRRDSESDGDMMDEDMDVNTPGSGDASETEQIDVVA